MDKWRQERSGELWNMLDVRKKEMQWSEEWSDGSEVTAVISKVHISPKNNMCSLFCLLCMCVFFVFNFLLYFSSVIFICLSISFLCNSICRWRNLSLSVQATCVWALRTPGEKWDVRSEKWDELRIKLFAITLTFSLLYFIHHFNNTLLHTHSPHFPF